MICRNVKNFRNVTLPFLILFLLILAAYANSFTAGWHLDDLHNILSNKNIHVENASVDTWLKTVKAPFLENAPLYRPAAMFSFAVNWYLGGPDVIGYHVVNVSIHCLVAALLFLTIVNLLKAPNMMGRYSGNEYLIAWLATALWALHPIQTQAVTYIVQRMASLAALFYLAGIYFYVKGRSCPDQTRSILFYGGCFLSYLLAFGTKENTITLPAALFLIEVIFYSKFAFYLHRKKLLLMAGVGLISAVAMFVLYSTWFGKPLESLLSGYQKRPFTLEQRLLTEPRILVFYLSQLFYPIPQRFSILHDFPLSKSLLAPWTTCGSIIFILSLIIFSVTFRRRWPLLSFAILFFFMAHTVESTIFPLELAFEHRNYLPSLFIFFPLASGARWLVAHYREKRPSIGSLVSVSALLVVLFLCVGTFNRNRAWANEKTLWEDARAKAPSYARPYQNLAMYYEKRGQFDKALLLYKQSLGLKDPAPSFSRFISLNNIGNAYKKMGQYDYAVKYLKMAVDSRGASVPRRVRYNLILCLLNNNEESEALGHLNFLLDNGSQSPVVLSTRGFVYFKRRNYDLALRDLRKALDLNPKGKDALLSMAMALSNDGHYDRAETYLTRAEKQYPDNIAVYLAIIENNLRRGNTQAAEKQYRRLENTFNEQALQDFIEKFLNGRSFIDNTLIPLDRDVLNPVVARLERQKKQPMSFASSEKGVCR